MSVQFGAFSSTSSSSSCCAFSLAFWAQNNFKFPNLQHLEIGKFRQISESTNLPTILLPFLWPKPTNLAFSLQPNWSNSNCAKSSSISFASFAFSFSEKLHQIPTFCAPNSSTSCKSCKRFTSCTSFKSFSRARLAPLSRASLSPSLCCSLADPKLVLESKVLLELAQTKNRPEKQLCCSRRTTNSSIGTVSENWGKKLKNGAKSCEIISNFSANFVAKFATKTMQKGSKKAAEKLQNRCRNGAKFLQKLGANLRPTCAHT